MRLTKALMLVSAGLAGLALGRFHY